MAAHPPPQGNAGQSVLLAVDVGLRLGLAEFDGTGRLLRYGSQHLANRTVLRQAVSAILRRLPGLRYVVLEGGGPLADIWVTAAERRGFAVLRTTAETWRQETMRKRDQRSGQQAKLRADRLARELICRHEAKRQTALRHDAAEAILAGEWACRRLGLAAEPLHVNRRMTNV